MHSKIPPRNRLAKVLPEVFREQLRLAGVPRRKYTAVVRAELADGTVIENVIVEQGWIVALTRDGLSGSVERRIELDPRDIVAIELLEHI
jgi:hypothetical protein